MVERVKVLARLNDAEHRRLTLYLVTDTVRRMKWFRLEAGNDVGYRTQVNILPHEFIALLKAGLEHFEVTAGLVNSVLPRLTRANIVR